RTQLARLRTGLPLRPCRARRASARTLRAGRTAARARLAAPQGRLAPAVGRGPRRRARRVAPSRRNRARRPLTDDAQAFCGSGFSRELLIHFAGSAKKLAA